MIPAHCLCYTRSPSKKVCVGWQRFLRACLYRSDPESKGYGTLADFCVINWARRDRRSYMRTILENCSQYYHYCYFQWSGALYRHEPKNLATTLGVFLLYSWLRVSAVNFQLTSDPFHIAPRCIYFLGLEKNTTKLILASAFGNNKSA
jgi:hypothetical protein